MLVYDKFVSSDSPVIQGTWTTAAWVKFLINETGQSIPSVMACYDISVWDVFECLNWS